MIIKPYFTYNWYSIYFYKNIFEIVQWLKDIIVRGLKGYCNTDLWEFYDYLSDIISNGLIDLKEQQHGCPCKIGQDLNEAEKEWDKVLDEIIEGFQAVKILADEYPEDVTRRKKFNKAMKLLHEHFFELWD